MKVTITIEERDTCLNINLHETGAFYTNKERRLVNMIIGAFPKTAYFTITRDDEDKTK